MKRISLEEKITTLLDNGEEITLSKTDFGTRKNQYKVKLKDGKEFFGRMFARLMSKVFNYHLKNK